MSRRTLSTQSGSALTYSDGPVQSHSPASSCLSSTLVIQSTLRPKRHTTTLFVAVAYRRVGWRRTKSIRLEACQLLPVDFDRERHPRCGRPTMNLVDSQRRNSVRFLWTARSTVLLAFGRGSGGNRVQFAGETNIGVIVCPPPPPSPPPRPSTLPPPSPSPPPPQLAPVAQR